LIGAGAALGTRLAGKEWLGDAAAAPAKKAAVVSIFLEGGMNALFSSADSFIPGNRFGVTATNTRDLGNGLRVDGATIGTLDAWSLGHIAAIGNRHGAIDHSSAQKNNFLGDNGSFVNRLAAAIGGPAAYKAVSLGSLPTPGVTPSEGGVSIQLLRTMSDVSTALGLGAIDYNRPARKAAAGAIAHSQAMSQAEIKKNATSMSPLRDAYTTLTDSLAKPPLALDVNAVAQAYGTTSGAGLDTMDAKLAAAELMIRAGTNVVTLSDTGWDTHGDANGTTVRNKMNGILPAIKRFLLRMRSETELAAMNISVIIHGDFARDLPSGDHAPALSALVIGSNVKVGTTGKVSDRVTLPNGTGASKEMWSYLAAISKVTTNPFGENPHALVL
jgi:hypothetical protein